MSRLDEPTVDAQPAPPDHRSGGGRAIVSHQFKLFRRDAARWINPQWVAAPREVDVPKAVRLLFRHPPLRAMGWLRFGSTGRELGIPGLSGWVQRWLLRLYGLEIAPSTTVLGGLYIAHSVGCELHAEFIGENVTIISQVTFGTRNDSPWPSSGHDVFVGVGARILGDFDVGSGAVIGANAVVIRDVSSGAVAAGVPATNRLPR